MLLASLLDDPLLFENKHKSSFARHKSIAIQPNSSIKNDTTSSNLSSGNSTNNTKTKSGIPLRSVMQNEPSTPTTSNAAPILVRHKSMPSPNGKLKSLCFINGT